MRYRWVSLAGIIVAYVFCRGAAIDEYSFTLVNPLVTATNLRAAYFFDESTGYIGGKAGAVLFTRDTCKTWTAYATPKRNWILSMYFHDVQNGWAVGGTPERTYCISTNDAGKSWKEHTIPGVNGKTIYKIRFLNRNTGWILGGSMAGGFAYLTQDGGETWQDRSPPDLTIPYHVLQDIIFIDSSAVIVCGYRGYLARTTDNGRNWQRILWKSVAPDSEIIAPLEQFHSISKDVVFCKGKEDILRSDDGGVTWHSRFFIGMHGNMQIGAFYFHNADSGFAIAGYGSGAIRFKTTNGGTTWAALLDTVGEVTEEILFPGQGKQGYMFGRDAQIYRITPMGDSKTQLNKGFTPSLGENLSLAFIDEKRGCFAGPNPVGFRTTIDGGKTWKIVDSTSNYGGVIAKDEITYAMNNGTITTDGGMTWQNAQDGKGGRRTFYECRQGDAVFFSSQVNTPGLGVRLFVTTDWFKTSLERTFPTAIPAGSLYFLNADTGWFVDTNTYFTTDGASTWTLRGATGGIYGASCVYFVDALVCLMYERN